MIARSAAPAAVVFFLVTALAGQAQDRTALWAERLRRAYPDFILGIRDNRVLWKDGTETEFDDGRKDKDWLTLMHEPDLEDQVSLEYPQDYPAGFKPAKNADAGRIRCAAFFSKMYGATRAEVEANLTAVRWLPSLQKTVVLVTRVNGVDRKLAAVSAELERLPAAYRTYLTNIGGAYVYRNVRKSTRVSMHSFGIAIDLNPNLTEFWNWTYGDELDDIVYRNRLPYEIARIFEKHGFIWGGKWYHYDTMHFEYRPELLEAADD